MATNNSKRGATGGIPGFSFLEGFARLVSTSLTAQAKAVNDTWTRVLSPSDDYTFRDWSRDLANLWQNGYAMTEDALAYPVRYQQLDRPAWASLVWNRDLRPDTTQDEIALTSRVDSDDTPTVTSLERLGPDNSDQIPGTAVSAALTSAGARLSVAIKGLAKIDPDVGHFVGFVTLPDAARPIAILFLTITGKAK